MQLDQDVTLTTPLTSTPPTESAEYDVRTGKRSTKGVVEFLDWWGNLNRRGRRDWMRSQKRSMRLRAFGRAARAYSYASKRRPSAGDGPGEPE